MTTPLSQSIRTQHRAIDGLAVCFAESLVRVAFPGEAAGGDDVAIALGQPLEDRS